MSKEVLQEELYSFGWPLILVHCGYCGNQIKSNEVFGVKVVAGKLKKCCDSDACIEQFFLDDE